MNNINIDNLFPKRGKTLNRPIDVNNMYYPVKNKKKGYIEFNVDQLLYEQDEKKQKIKNEYKSVFNLCLKKIKTANKLNKRDIIYDVPETVLMCPGYNSLDCLLFIEDRLRKLYIDTLIMSLNQIFISWNNVRNNKKENIDKKKNDSDSYSY